MSIFPPHSHFHLLYVSFGLSFPQPYATVLSPCLIPLPSPQSWLVLVIHLSIMEILVSKMNKADWVTEGNIPVNVHQHTQTPAHHSYLCFISANSSWSYMNRQPCPSEVRGEASINTVHHHALPVKLPVLELLFLQMMTLNDGKEMLKAQSTEDEWYLRHFLLVLPVSPSDHKKLSTRLKAQYQHPHWMLMQEQLLSHSNNQNNQTKTHKELNWSKSAGQRSCKQNHNSAKALYHMTFGSLSWVDFRLTTELHHIQQVLKNYCKNWPKGNLISASYLTRDCLLLSHTEF